MASRESKNRVFYYDRWDTFKGDLYRQLDLEDLSSGEQDPQYIFRGHSNHDWRPQATFFREIEKAEKVGIEIKAETQKKIYESVLKKFCVQLATDKEYRHLFPSDKQADPLKEPLKSQLEQLARHYELPSQLTDWSESPYIAAFFAFSQFLANDLFSKSDPHSDSRRFVGVWALKKSKVDATNKKKVIEGDTLLGTNPRLRGQRGLFVHMSEKDLDIEDYLADKVDGLTLFAISAEKKQVIRALNDLDLMGITYASLYTGIIGYVEHAKMRMQMELLDPPK